MDQVVAFLVALLLAGLVLLVVRAVVLWYWKVNQALELLLRIEQSTARIAVILGEVHSDAAEAAQKKASELAAALR